MLARLKNVYYGWIIVAVLTAANFTEVGEFNPVLAVFMKPFADDFGWGRAQVAWGITLGSIGGGVIGPFVGRLIDKHGSRTVLNTFQIVFGTCLASLAFLQGSFLHFLIAYAGGRMVVQGGTSLAVQVAVAQWFVRRRGRAMGITILGTRGGQAILPVVIAGITEAWGWRGAWAVLGGLVLVMGILPSLLLLKRRPEDLGLLPDGVKPGEQTIGADGMVTAARTGIEEDAWTLKEALRTRSLWLLAVAASLTYFVGAGVNLHLYPYLTDVGLPTGQAIFVASGFFAISAAGSFVWGTFLDRIPLRYVLGTVLSMGVVSMGLLLWIDSLPKALAFMLFYGAAFGGTQTVITVMWATYYGRANVGAISGAMLPIMLTTNAMGPLFGGWAYDTIGNYTLAFTVYGVACAIGAVAAFTAGAPRPRPVAVAATQLA